MTHPSAGSNPESRYPPDAAAAALERAQHMEGAVRRQSRWLIRFFALFGVGAFLSTLWRGLMIDSAWQGWLYIAVWGGFCVALVGYAATRRVQSPGTNTRAYTVAGTWIVTDFVALVVGDRYFADTLAWWLPAAAVLALICFAGAYWEHRR